MGGKQSKGSVTEKDKAILDLKIQRDRLLQYQKRIDVLVGVETENARRALADGDEPRARLALRKRKYQQSLRAKTDGQLQQVEQLASQVELAQIQKDVLTGLQQGTKALMDIHAEIGGIEKVEKLMNDSADQMAYQKEISELLGSKMSTEDEAEVEDELAALEAEVGGKEQTQTLPSVPSAELPEAAQREPKPAAVQEERQAIPA
ncbi:hypothetical protein NLU13_3428 [Sarocladium strictum]|uniref:Uncharacterized protein n=1 Tax=Sarocladium strictum TaxID=5046 RepID=A0AA39LAE2_SARSR|nr:hypothetical protein NLU13_3428 [Sarocladium strictum]